MKARPVILVKGEGYKFCPIEEATHVQLRVPSPSGVITLSVITSGARKNTNCWTWNGDTERPTLRPSVKTSGHQEPEDGGPFVCHSWITDGNIQFLDDCTHNLVGTTVQLLEVAP